MDYTVYLQGFDLDGQLMEERSLPGNFFSSTSAHGLFQHPAHMSPLPPISMSGPGDPSLLQINEHGWFNRLKISPAGNLGVDTSGSQYLPHQRPNFAMQNGHFDIPADMMLAAISSDSFQVRGDVAPHAQWQQMCSLSSDEYLNDTMPQLISDSTVQQACVYTSSSDCPHEADSSGSSERALSRSCLVGSPSDEMNWLIFDVLQGNLGSSTAGFPLDGFPNDCSSVVADLDTLDSSRHALSSLASMPGPAGDGIPILGPVSWMSPSTIELGNGSMVTSLLNQHIPNLDDPFGACLSTESNGAPPYKRQRASYKLENSSAAKTLSRPVIPSLSSSSSSTKSSGSDYPITTMNITDALYKDFQHVSRSQTMFLPKPTVFEAVGGSAMKRDQLDSDLKFHRKQNVTSIEPQSVAARHRRRKISERVRVLEKLIPGGNKMDTASMLDESIEYVKFLQLQVQLLESLGDMSYGPNASLSSDIGRGKDGLGTRTNTFGAQASQSCTTMQMVRPAASPLILSEILQEQLFKQKLCLVSLRQCPPTTRSSTSGSYA
ncbi:unnamed protein product [Calypogeia fissa]